jgi:hypothetical protein
MSWYWKSDLRLKDEDESGWTLYDDEATKKLEKAYQKGQKTMKLSEKHKIDFKDMIQHRIEVRCDFITPEIFLFFAFSAQKKKFWCSIFRCFVLEGTDLMCLSHEKNLVPNDKRINMQKKICCV